MSLYRLTDQSRDDLTEIWLYIANDRPAAADRMIDEITERLILLADQPGLGRARDEVRAGLRSFPVGNYMIFYRAIPGGVEIARILSGYRDIPNVISPE